MELLENPSVKTKYQKCKLRVKRWESEFMEKYGRRPKKNDIKKADSTIKESYKMYWKLKTQALEETLLDITFTDECQANVSANSSFLDVSTSLTLDTSSITAPLDTSDKSESPDKSESTKTISILETSLKNVENINPVKSPVKDVILDIDDSKTKSLNVDGVWGEHLNKEAEAPKKSTKLLIGRSSSFQLSQKKFTSTSFTKRNPRKSLSMHRIKSKSDLNTSTSSTKDEDKPQEAEEVATDSIFGENVKITQLEPKSVAQPVNAIRKIISGGPMTVDRKLNTGWLDRCAKESGLEPLPINSQRLSGVSDSGVESMDTSVFSPMDSTPSVSAENSAQISDDEEFVCNSDSEEESRKRIRNWRKTLSDGSLPLYKRPCLETSPEIPISTFVPPRFSLPGEKSSAAIKSLRIEDHLGPDESPTQRKDVTTPITTTNEAFNEEKCGVDEENVKEKPEEAAEIEKVPEIAESPVVAESSAKSAANRKRAPRRPKQLDSDEDDEEEKPKARKPRVSRKKVSKKSDESSEKKPRKAAAKRTTRTRKKVHSEEEEEKEAENVEEPESSKTPEIPIYGVEALEVVPRFTVPRETNGDLVTEFANTVGEAAAIATKKPRSQMSDKEKFEEKMASGKANENFVRINLKKKVFVRGKRNFNFSKYKKNQWKQRKKELSSSEGALDLADLAEKNTCFKCGGSGHISRRCPEMKSEELLPLNELGEEPSDFPTLEEVEKMAKKEAVLVHATRIHLLPQCPSISNEKNLHPGSAESSDHPEADFYFDDEDSEDLEAEEEDKEPAMVGHKIPEELLAKLLPPINGTIDPVYPTSSGIVEETPKEVFDALKMFGHENFRPGQEKAIMRILSGQSTLVTLSTGSGKSLCYQLPAYLYAKRSHCITLVISPLVSLMDDQVTGVPSFLSAAALHTGQTDKVRQKIMDTIKEGKLDILLVSPEAIVAGERSTGFGSLLRQLPPIAFACIDEAHCISQWSHNFRPSYLMICRVLLEKLGVKTILGLTATATRNTSQSIVEHLRIHDGTAGVISDIPMPNNLTLTVSKDEHRDQALISLLRSERFKECDSIIVYCTRREECTRIAGNIRISLQDTVDPNKPKPKAKVSQISEAYHAGLPASRRKVIQKSFMNGDTRIVVATVAFGMGINKPNIRSVIHFNMPKSFEGYVQEVGRAGRDNLPAHCHLFLSPQEDRDKWELRRHIYSDGVDRHTIRRLLQKIFLPCSCGGSRNRKRCPGHEVAIPIDETIRALDISEETISTLLCYLELHPKKFITVLSSVYVNAKVSSYNGPKALKDAAQVSPPLAMAIALDAKKGVSHEKDSVVEFPVVDIAAAIGWDSGVVKSHLKNLEWTTFEGKSQRSAISVRYDTLGLRVRAPGDLTDAELDEALEALYERTGAQESASLQQLETIHAALEKFSHHSVRQCVELNDENSEKSEGLKKIIRDYFQSTSPLSIVEESLVKNNKIPVNESQVISDIRSLIASYRDNNFTGRAVARIFHGIQSPNYSALTWSRCRFWRAHLQTDFNQIVQLATKEILAMR